MRYGFDSGEHFQPCSNGELDFTGNRSTIAHPRAPTLFPVTPSPAALPPDLGGLINQSLKSQAIRKLVEVEDCLLAAKTCGLGLVGGAIAFTAYVCLASVLAWGMCHFGAGAGDRASGVVGFLLGLVA